MNAVEFGEATSIYLTKRTIDIDINHDVRAVLAGAGFEDAVPVFSVEDADEPSGHPKELFVELVAADLIKVEVDDVGVFMEPMIESILKYVGEVGPVVFGNFPGCFAGPFTSVKVVEDDGRIRICVHLRPRTS